MSQAISSANVSGFASELAVLLLENETSQSQSARLERDAARQTYLDEAEQQVAALHAAADAISSGAYVSGALTVAGGLCTMTGAAYKYDAATDTRPDASAKDALMAACFTKAGDLASGVAQPLKLIIGDGPAEEHKADAKQHEVLASQAQWQASDANGEIDKAEKQSAKVLDLVEAIERDQNASTNALIGRI